MSDKYMQYAKAKVDFLLAVEREAFKELEKRSELITEDTYLNGPRKQVMKIDTFYAKRIITEMIERIAKNKIL